MLLFVNKVSPVLLQQVLSDAWGTFAIYNSNLIYWSCLVIREVWAEIAIF